MNNKWFQNPNTNLLILIFSISICFSIFIYPSISMILFLSYYVIVFIATKDLFLSNEESKLHSSLKQNFNLNPRLIRFGLILPFIYLLVNNFTSSYPLHFHYVILICYSFLPGIILLDLFDISKHFTILENLLVSYVISYFCTALLWSLFLTVNYIDRTFLLINIYILLGIVNFVKKFNSRQTIKYRPSLFSNKDGYLLFLICAFYLLTFSLLYPELAVLLSSDISRHFEQAHYLLNSHEYYNYINYFFSNSYESAVIAQYTYAFPNTIILFQKSHSLLNLLLPIAVYCLLKKYIETFPFEKINYAKKIPILGTMLWSLFSPSFSGFGVIYLFIQRLLNPSLSYTIILSKAFLYTNYGSSYGFYGLTFLPLHTNILLIILLLWVIIQKDLPKILQNVVFSLIYLAIFLTHLPEGIYFGLFLCFVYFFSIKKERFKHFIFSGILCNLIILIIYYELAISNFFQMNVFDLSFISVCVSLVAFVGILILKSFKIVNSGIEKLKGLIEKTSLIHRLLPVILWAFSFSFVNWLILNVTYDFSQIPEGTIPWYNYNLIGFPLLLAIFGYAEYIKQPKKTELNVLILFLLFTVIFGQLISLSKIYFLDLNYWEFRFGIFLNITLCFFAAISLFALYEKWQLNKPAISLRKKHQFLVLLNLFFIIGFTSNLMSIQTWYGYKASKSANIYREMTFSDNELAALQDIKLQLLNDSNAWLTTLDYSQSPLNLVGTKYIHVFGDYNALRSPELSFRYAYVGTPFSHPYIYMNYIRDSHVVGADYFSRYYSLYLTEYVNYLPIFRNDTENTIYNGNKLSFPLLNASISLALPFNTPLDRFERYFSPILLSDGMVNYSTYYFNDRNLLNSNTIVLSFDPENSESLAIFDEYAKMNKTIIIFNTNGVSQIGNQLLDFSPTPVNHSINSISYPLEKRTLNYTFYMLSDYYLKQNSSKAVINFTNEDGLQFPMLIEMPYLNSTLYYCNIAPILTYFRSINSPLPTIDDLRPLVQYLNLTPINETNLSIETFDYVKEISLENATVSSNTVLFAPNSNLNLDINLKNGSILKYSNIYFNNLGFNQKSLQFQSLLLDRDYSYYTKISTSAPILLQFTGDNEFISLSTNQTFETQNILSIQITPNSTMSCVLRTPQVNSNALYLKLFQTYNQLGSYSNKNITIVGNTSFQITVSDYYYALSNFNCEGTIFSENMQSSGYDQITPLKYGIVSAIITTPVLYYGWKFFTKKKDEKLSDILSN